MSGTDSNFFLAGGGGVSRGGRTGVLDLENSKLYRKVPQNALSMEKKIIN